MKLLRDDERPVEIHNNSPTEVEFALLFAPKVKDKDLKSKIAQESKWQTVPGELTHRRLINDQAYSRFADLVLNYGNGELSTFKAIVEIRFPELLNIDEQYVKKKKERNMAHGIGEWVKFVENFVTLEMLQFIFDFMYTGNVDLVLLDIEKQIEFYSIAKKLKYEKLITFIRSYIEKSVDIHNVFLVLKFADAQKIDELKNFVINFCLNNWHTISGSKDGLTIIGLSLFQELTVANSQLQSKPALIPPTEPPENTIVEDFQKIRSLMHFADAVSKFGNDIIPFHRCVLAAASPKFQTMFLKESSSSKKLSTYSFDSISGGAFRGLIDLIYSGTTNISPNEACELLEHIAVPFDLYSVREDCEALICEEDKIDASNVMNVLRITYLKCNEGRAHLTIKARSHCLSFICAHFSEIDMKELKTFDSCTAWEILEMLHDRFKSNNIPGLS